jgi:hypothetical protein
MEKEVYKLIATRVPPSDRWRLVDDGPESKIYLSLTETLEAYFQKTQAKCEFRLAPLKGELYMIATENVEIIPEPPKKFNIYGDY